MRNGKGHGVAKPQVGCSCERDCGLVGQDHRHGMGACKARRSFYATKSNFYVRRKTYRRQPALAHFIFTVQRVNDVTEASAGFSKEYKAKSFMTKTGFPLTLSLSALWRFQCGIPPRVFFCAGQNPPPYFSLFLQLSEESRISPRDFHSRG